MTLASINFPEPCCDRGGGGAGGVAASSSNDRNLGDELSLSGLSDARSGYIAGEIVSTRSGPACRSGKVRGTPFGERNIAGRSLNRRTWEDWSRLLITAPWKAGSPINSCLNVPADMPTINV